MEFFYKCIVDLKSIAFGVIKKSIPFLFLINGGGHLLGEVFIIHSNSVGQNRSELEPYLSIRPISA